MSDVSLNAQGERTLGAAETACKAANVGIISAEHLLGAALLVLNEEGSMANPAKGQIEHAMRASQGMGSEALDTKVMFGSTARAAMSFTAAALRVRGGGEIDARALAIGTVLSDEVNPMFFESLGLSRHELLAALDTPS